ncbi:MAG TPA: CAP domain-containing protein [Candidatus Dormibacteraeota bacterium]
MHFNLVDGLVLAVCLLALADGARRGFTTYATELSAFAFGLGLAFVVFEPVSSFLHRALGVPLGLGGFGVFLIVLVVGHGAMQAAVHGRFRWLAAELGLDPDTGRHLNKRAGALPAVGTAVLVSALVLTALVVMPSSGYRSLVLASTLGSRIVGEASFIEPPLLRLLERAQNDGSAGNQPQVPADAGENAFYRLHLPDQLDTSLDLASENRMLALVNQTRQENGLRPLAVDALLQAAARDHSLDMYQRHYFSHNTPDGQNPFDRMRAHGAHFVTAGENIAFAPDVDQAYQSLLASPDHRANILNGDFRCVGIGVYRAVGYEEMFTQDFSDCVS